MNRTVNEWAGVKVASVFGGSEAQARNVLQMALDDIAALAAERDRFERNRDMWRGQCLRQAAAMSELTGLPQIADLAISTPEVA